MVYDSWGTSRGYKYGGLVQEIRNSSALAMELCLSCTYPLNYSFVSIVTRGLKDAT